MTAHPSIARQAITAADRVLLDIQQAIVDGTIPAGSKISEPELARRFDISRAPLREALARLERCHLIERTPNAGARVVTLTPQGLAALYQIREELEGLACRLAAEQMPEAEIQELAALLDQPMPRTPIDRDAAPMLFEHLARSPAVA